MRPTHLPVHKRYSSATAALTGRRVALRSALLLRHSAQGLCGIQMHGCRPSH